MLIYCIFIKERMGLPTSTGIALAGWTHPAIDNGGCVHPPRAQNNNPTQLRRAERIDAPKIDRGSLLGI
jgi:hypothetical protein